MVSMKHAPTIKNFGNRLAKLRKTKGLTQADLADKLGISRRMVAYYEAESEHIPANILVPLSKILKTSLDELLGIKNIKESNKEEHAALWRKLRKLEQLSKNDQKTILKMIDIAVKNSNGST